MVAQEEIRQENFDAVVKYLREGFQGSSVVDLDSCRPGKLPRFYNFIVRYSGATHCLSVDAAFLMDLTVEQIIDCLGRYGVAAGLRRAGTRRIVLTADGLSPWL